MKPEQHEHLSLDRINKILMSARFATCSYETAQTLKQLKKEIRKEKPEDRGKDDIFLQKEIKTVFKRFECIKYKFFRDEKSSGDAMVFLLNERGIPDRPNEKRKTYLVISIAGTHSFRDIIQDLNIFKRKFEDTEARVHAGFYNQFLALKPKIRNRVEVILNETLVDEILITGHSLGGAVAAMFGAYLAAEFENQNFRVVTFGCPKPGNSDFRELFQQRVKKHLRVRVTTDPVTLVPMLIPWFRIGFVNILLYFEYYESKMETKRATHVMTIRRRIFNSAKTRFLR
ncbi:Oidioi.mRNA.OKI2018_I69.PAR.g8461.t1.cds [Oikopleura dioica]|uniref:Oidioi.mRNA.OKI2018_I69.PAR.g8461.t1.cds n=1 Tax=Oikopleura dioica TaxID=34765 RepID=A0ABN7RG12_OIKDI|nr:Oidioi.mRNA.OKI2018_I69.PAR.g8461.t1.cds [Oikopleura dioica]